MRTTIYNRTEFKQKRKDLRNNPTKSEKLLWNILKGKRLGGFKIRRQYGVDKYVIDFYCAEKKLAIEIDGVIHDCENSQKYDSEREEFIKQFGIKFLRIRNEDVEKDIGMVAEIILRELRDS